MRRPVLPLSAFALALGLCACAPVRWHKPGADEAMLAQDLAACRKSTQGRFGASGPPGMTNADPRFGAPSGPSQADVRMQEAQAAGACMRGKGYVLVEEK